MDKSKSKVKEVRLFDDDGEESMIFTRYHGGTVIIEDISAKTLISLSSKHRNEFARFCSLTDTKAN